MFPILTQKGAHFSYLFLHLTFFIHLVYPGALSKLELSVEFCFFKFSLFFVL